MPIFDGIGFECGRIVRLWRMCPRVFVGSIDLSLLNDRAAVGFGPEEEMRACFIC
ncbi:hypothetical protein MINT15_35640 [Saccharomonospora viridis]|uniref:Uncharacterized protein n=1 Tax=Saccharomonospora viridis TaxID=1852 RepID=A0A837D7D5_9PSEU|nr:hypothetical protein MINT15_35640 [Saccharomonospora viridis]